MKKVMLLVAVALIASTTAYADTIVLKEKDITSRQTTGSFTGSGSVYVAPMIVNEMDKIGGTSQGSEKIAFCCDFTTNTSDAFAKQGAEFTVNQIKAINDDYKSATGYSGVQLGFIQNLFDHVYWDVVSAIDPATVNPVAAAALQMCIWEIQMETKLSLSLKDGTFTGNTGSDADALANKWLTALNNDNWTGTGYEAINICNLTIFSAGRVTQSLISAELTGKSSTESATPEPATMMILGLGAVGAGFAARRRMKG